MPSPQPSPSPSPTPTPSPSLSSLSSPTEPPRSARAANLRYFRARRHGGTEPASMAAAGRVRADVVRSPFDDLEEASSSSDDGDDDGFGSTTSTSSSSSSSYTSSSNSSVGSWGSQLVLFHAKGPSSRRWGARPGEPRGETKPTTLTNNRSVSTEWTQSSSLLHRHDEGSYEGRREDVVGVDDAEGSTASSGSSLTSHNHWSTVFLAPSADEVAAPTVSNQGRSHSDGGGDAGSLQASLREKLVEFYVGRDPRALRDVDRELQDNDEGRTPEVVACLVSRSEPSDPAAADAAWSSGVSYPLPPPTGSGSVQYYLVLSSHPRQRFVIELFNDQVPIAVARFEAALCLHGRAAGRAAREWNVRKIVPHSYVQLGRGANGDGTGTGDEGTVEALPDVKELSCVEPLFQHSEAGLLSMRTTTPTDIITSPSEFIITVRPMPRLDGRRRVVGRVLEGLDSVLKDLTRNTAVDDGLRPMFEVISIIEAGMIIDGKEKRQDEPHPTLRPNESRNPEQVRVVPSEDATGEIPTGEDLTARSALLPSTYSLASFKAAATSAVSCGGNFSTLAAIERVDDDVQYLPLPNRQGNPSILFDSLSTASDGSESAHTGMLETSTEPMTVPSAKKQQPSRAANATGPADPTGSLSAAALPFSGSATSGIIDLTGTESISFSVFLRSPSTVGSIGQDTNRDNLWVGAGTPSSTVWGPIGFETQLVEEDCLSDVPSASHYDEDTELSETVGAAPPTKLEPPGRVLDKTTSAESSHQLNGGPRCSGVVDGSDEAPPHLAAVADLSSSLSLLDFFTTSEDAVAEFLSVEGATSDRNPPDDSDPRTATAHVPPRTLDVGHEDDDELVLDPPNLGSISFSPVASPSTGVRPAGTASMEAVDSSTFDNDDDRPRPGSNDRAVVLFPPTAAATLLAGSLSRSFLWFGGGEGGGGGCSVQGLEEEDGDDDDHAGGASPSYAPYGPPRGTHAARRHEELRSALRPPKYSPATTFLRIGTTSPVAAGCHNKVEDSDLRPPRAPRGGSRKRNKVVASLSRDFHT